MLNSCNTKGNSMSGRMSRSRNRQKAVEVKPPARRLEATMEASRSCPRLSSAACPWPSSYSTSESSMNGRLSKRKSRRRPKEVKAPVLELVSSRSSLLRSSESSRSPSNSNIRRSSTRKRPLPSQLRQRRLRRRRRPVQVSKSSRKKKWAGFPWRSNSPTSGS